MTYEYDEERFTEALLYVARRLEDDPAGGAMKLNKALFFSEFAHMRAHGRPISGADYQKLEHGPAPRRLLPVRQALIARGEAVLREEVLLGRVQQRLIPLRDPDTAKLTSTELEVLDQVVETTRGATGTAVSQSSHREPGWQMVDDGETIPYETAFLRPTVLTDKIRQRAATLAAERGLS